MRGIDLGCVDQVLDQHPAVPVEMVDMRSAVVPHTGILGAPVIFHHCLPEFRALEIEPRPERHPLAR